MVVTQYFQSQRKIPAKMENVLIIWFSIQNEPNNKIVTI